MLLIRDRLAEQEASLTMEEKKQLAEADRWWWYLDVLTQLPDLSRHFRASWNRPEQKRNAVHVRQVHNSRRFPHIR